MKGPRAPKFGSSYPVGDYKKSSHKVGPAARGGAEMKMKATGVTKSNLASGEMKPKKGK